MMGILVSSAGAAAGIIEATASEHRDLSLSCKSPGCPLVTLRMSSHLSFLGGMRFGFGNGLCISPRYNLGGLTMPGCLRIFDVCFYAHNGLITDIEPCLLCAMCGRLRVGKKNLHVAGLVGAAMFGL